MLAKFAIGFLTGLFVGVAVFSHAFLRAVVLGVITGAIFGALVVYGVDGYVNWATGLPADIAGLPAFWFWFGGFAGIITGARLWAVRHTP